MLVLEKPNHKEDNKINDKTKEKNERKICLAFR